LFVFSRDLSKDPSAAFTLRHALGLARRGCGVVVALLDGALDRQSGEAGVVIARCVDAGAQVRLVGRMEGKTTLPLDDVVVMEETELAGLMLGPGTKTLWC
jgi:hypothetical protein